MEIKTLDKPIEPLKKEYTNDKIEKLRKEGNKKVKGVFKCFEPRGGSVTFTFKAFPNDPIRPYTFVDGETYEIPLAVAKHLNNNCAYPVHSRILDSAGNPKVDTEGKKVSRFSFQSTDFS